MGKELKETGKTMCKQNENINKKKGIIKRYQKVLMLKFKIHWKGSTADLSQKKLQGTWM